jgi:prepilin-type N-terminal cleavage/methylation domain-containing protein
MLMRTVPDRRPLGRCRRGFSLAEIVVALVIIAIMAAVIYPTVASNMRDSRSTALAQTFSGLSQGIAEYKRAITRYPGSLLLLTTAPVAADPDICGNNTTATLAALWRGPYASRLITTDGLSIGDATMPTGLRRVQVGSNFFLMIDAPAVETEVADALEALYDAGTPNAGTGTIRSQTGGIALTPTSAAIAAAPTGTINVSYAIPINSC